MMRSLPVVLLLLAAACSDDDAAAGGGGGGFDKAKKMGALTAAELPAVCDAWADVTGGYGADPFKKDCGNAFATSYPPTSQKECIQAFEAKKADASCTSTVGGFLECKTILHGNPCATVGESRVCTPFLTNEACQAP